MSALEPSVPPDGIVPDSDDESPSPFPARFSPADPGFTTDLEPSSEAEVASFLLGTTAPFHSTPSAGPSLDDLFSSSSSESSSSSGLSDYEHRPLPPEEDYSSSEEDDVKPPLFDVDGFAVPALPADVARRRLALANREVHRALEAGGDDDDEELRRSISINPGPNFPLKNKKRGRRPQPPKTKPATSKERNSATSRKRGPVFKKPVPALKKRRVAQDTDETDISSSSAAAESSAEIARRWKLAVASDDIARRHKELAIASASGDIDAQRKLKRLAKVFGEDGRRKKKKKKRKTRDEDASDTATASSARPKKQYRLLKHWTDVGVRAAQAETHDDSDPDDLLGSVLAGDTSSPDDLPASSSSSHTDRPSPPHRRHRAPDGATRAWTAEERRLANETVAAHRRKEAGRRAEEERRREASYHVGDLYCKLDTPVPIEPEWSWVALRTDWKTLFHLLGPIADFDDLVPDRRLAILVEHQPCRSEDGRSRLPDLAFDPTKDGDGEEVRQGKPVGRYLLQAARYLFARDVGEEELRRLERRTGWEGLTFTYLECLARIAQGREEFTQVVKHNSLIDPKLDVLRLAAEAAERDGSDPWGSAMAEYEECRELIERTRSDGPVVRRATSCFSTQQDDLLGRRPD